MNLEIMRGISGGPGAKVSLDWLNAANVVRKALETAGLAKLFGMASVFITGSRVWRPAYGLEIAPGTDVDILINAPTTIAHAIRQQVTEVLGLTGTGISTAPSLDKIGEVLALPGMKFRAKDGTTVDIFGADDALDLVSSYTEDSHGSARMAWSCEHHCLVMFPNPKAHL